jgi:hypothetical protein
MRRPVFGIWVAVLTFAFGVYAALVWHAFASRSASPPPPARPAPKRAADAPPALCKVHHAAMRTERVPIHYGMPVNAPARYEAERKLFPNSRRVVLGGCEVRKETHTELPVCATCRAAEEEWRRRHPKEF